MVKKRFLYWSLLLLLLSWWGCTKKDKTYTKQQMQHIVDSIVQKRSVYLKQQAQKDLNLRLPIELKPKVDSILNQRMTTLLPPQMDTIGENIAMPLDSVTATDTLKVADSSKKK